MRPAHQSKGLDVVLIDDPSCYPQSIHEVPVGWNLHASAIKLHSQERNVESPAIVGNQDRDNVFGWTVVIYEVHELLHSLPADTPVHI